MKFNEALRSFRIQGHVKTGGGGSGGATGNRPAKNITEEGARLNHAHALDASAGSAGGGSAGSLGGGGGVTDVSSPQFARSADVTQPSVERDLFDRQTGGVAAGLRTTG